MNKYIGLLLACCCIGLKASAQIGEHRNDFAVGLNGASL